MKKYDILLFGATGFTGRLIARYLATCTNSGLTWAICGRNKPKVDTLLDELNTSQNPDVFIADNADQTQVDKLVSSSRVVLSAAGPFMLYSPCVVDACMRFNTHYVDISGEVPWAAHLIKQYHKKAVENNVLLVPMSGFDSAPSDLGTLFTVNTMKQQHNTTTQKVRSYATLQGKLSGGTLYTGILVEKTAKHIADDPFALGGTAGTPRKEELDNPEPQYDADMDCWSSPFMMAQINTRVVRRTAMLFNESERQEVNPGYQEDFLYSERQYAPNEDKARTAAQVWARLPSAELREAAMKKGKIAQPGQGPTAEQRKRSWFEFLFAGTSGENETVITRCWGGDPGYDETAKMVSELALHCLEPQSERARAGLAVGGCVTPALAGGIPLIEKYQKAGIVFEQLDATGVKLIATGPPSPP